MDREFLNLLEVAETLDISGSQAYALVRSGDLRAVKIGGRGQWRVEVAELHAYIQAMYAQTAAFVAAHPYGPTDTAAGEPFDIPDTPQVPAKGNNQPLPAPCSSRDSPPAALMLVAAGVHRLGDVTLLQADLLGVRLLSCIVASVGSAQAASSRRGSALRPAM